MGSSKIFHPFESLPKNISIDKVAVLEDGRLAIWPDLATKDFQRIYREACGVYWDKKRCCFQSTIPKDWSYGQWYEQILSVVKIGFGIKLHLTDQTEFVSEDSTFTHEVIKRDGDIHKQLYNEKGQLVKTEVGLAGQDTETAGSRPDSALDSLETQNRAAQCLRKD
jgi:hypothetical protein